MKIETINIDKIENEDPRIREYDKLDELFAIKLDAEVVAKKFGEASRNNEWCLYLTFDQIGTLKSKNINNHVILSIKKNKQDEIGIYSKKENQNIVFQFLRKLKYC